MGNFRELGGWKRAHNLALWRAAVSVISNIAEGTGRRNDRELARFLGIARGSVREIECQLLLSRDLEYLSSEDWLVLDADSQEVSRMLNGLMQRVRKTR